MGEVGNRASEHMKEEGESDFAVDAARGIGPARNHQANRKSPIAPTRDASRTRRLRLTSFSTTTAHAPATVPLSLVLAALAGGRARMLAHAGACRLDFHTVSGNNLERHPASTWQRFRDDSGSLVTTRISPSCRPSSKAR